MERRELRDVHVEGREKGEGRRERGKGRGEKGEGEGRRGRRERGGGRGEKGEGRREREKGEEGEEGEGRREKEKEKGNDNPPPVKGGREDPLVDVKHEGTANEHNWPSFPISPSHKGCIPTSVLAPTDNRNSTTASWPA